MIVCANPFAQFASYQDEIEDCVLRVMRSNQYILGPEVCALEDEFARYIGAKEAIGVANGTDAIELALRALEIGVGDEVITVSHTAVATVAAIEAAGATPVLVDIDPASYLLNPRLLDEVLTPRTRAVLAVHLYGRAVELDAIMAFCNRNGLLLIEDVSQAHGAEWHERKLGSFGVIGCFSCYPTKNLGAIGDAGLITTNDSKLAEKIKAMREYGWKSRYISDLPGRNSRMDELQAAILRVKLRHLDSDNNRRISLAADYSRLLVGMGLDLPESLPSGRSVFHLYVVGSSDRDVLVAHLGKCGVQTGIHYPVPIHLQPAYIGRIKTSKEMVVTELAAKRVMSLPIYPEFSFEDLQIVVNAIQEFRHSLLGG